MFDLMKPNSYLVARSQGAMELRLDLILTVLNGLMKAKMDCIKMLKGLKFVQSSWNKSSRPLPRDKDEDPADGDEAVFQGGHGQDGELGTVFQRQNRQKPPTPGRTTCTALRGRTEND